AAARAAAATSGEGSPEPRASHRQLNDDCVVVARHAAAELRDEAHRDGGAEVAQVLPEQHDGGRVGHRRDPDRRTIGARGDLVETSVAKRGLDERADAAPDGVDVNADLAPDAFDADAILAEVGCGGARQLE